MGGFALHRHAAGGGGRERFLRPLHRLSGPRTPGPTALLGAWPRDCGAAGSVHDRRQRRRARPGRPARDVGRHDAGRDDGLLPVGGEFPAADRAGSCSSRTCSRCSKATCSASTMSYDAPEDPVLARSDEEAAERPPAFDKRLRLTGRVELRNVTFGYKTTGDPLLKDFSLVVEPGQRVAVVGPSGSGKSTLASLVAGTHRPWSGEILFDGQPRAEVPRRSPDGLGGAGRPAHLPVRRLGARQPGHVGSGNAGSGPGGRGQGRRYPCGYHRPAPGLRRSRAGGWAQLQRRPAAAVLKSPGRWCRIPPVLILDEATCALDPVAELRIDDALRSRGITCLIVAPSP